MNNKAQLYLINSVLVDDKLVPAGTRISLSIEALRTAFEKEPSFKDMIKTKIIGNKKRGRPRKNEVDNNG